MAESASSSFELDARLRDEDQQLREARATGRRTMFMLFTGPLMVLAVILALFFGWRAWQRRESR